MARHKIQSADLETDGAPTMYTYPDLPSPPAVDSHNNRDMTQDGSYWPAVSIDSGVASSIGNTDTSVRSAGKRDSGFCTDDSSNNSRLSSLFQNMSLCSSGGRSHESVPHRRTPSSSLSSHSHVASFHSLTTSSTGRHPKKELDHDELVETMTTLKADPSRCMRQDEDGDTLLHLAVLHNNLTWIVMILQALSSRALLNLRNSLSQTVLHLAVLGNHLKVVRLLVGHGASLEVRDRNGNTPLHLACRDGDLNCVKQLTTPLQSEEVVTLSSENATTVPQVPQNADVRNYHGDGCIHLAAAAGHLDIVQHLVEGPCRANINFPDGRSGRTILHNAVESRDMALISFLLQYRYTLGLNVDAQTYCGNSALSLALGRGYRDVAEFLVLAGADPVSPAVTDTTDAFSDVSASSSVGDVSMDSEDFQEDDFYDDLCVNGTPVYSGVRQTW